MTKLHFHFFLRTQNNSVVHLTITFLITNAFLYLLGFGIY
jgi:hypothetical protein